MSAAIHGNHNVVFGVKAPLPLKGFPQGRIRLRIRNTGFAQAFVKSESGIRHFYISEKEGFWTPIYEQGSNHREEVA